MSFKKFFDGCLLSQLIRETAKLPNLLSYLLNCYSSSLDAVLFIIKNYFMLKTKGTLIWVGLPPTPAQLAMFNIVFQGREIAGSLIGGIPETQEMLDYCAAQNITTDVEIINMKTLTMLTNAWNAVM